MNQPFENHLIVTDLDGAFLGCDARLVPKNLDAIARFQAGGGRFCVATGRGLYSLADALPDHQTLCNAPIIACNGALLYDAQKKEIIKECNFYFDAHLKTALALCAQSFPQIRYWIHTETVSATFSAEIPCAEPLGLVRKIVICNPREASEPALEKIRRALSRTLQGQAYLSLSSREYLEVMPLGATKGAMVSALRDYYRAQGMEMTVYAVGDYENDLEMLGVADVSACPQNAIEQVKKQSQIQLCHHDEGAIADLIDKIMTQTL